MIEVKNIDIHNESESKEVLQKSIVATVRIICTKENTSMRIKVVYGVSVNTDLHDQILYDETAEEIPSGLVEFSLECNSPDVSKIPREHLVGVSTLMFIFYTPDDKMFSRIGYFVRVEYPGVYVKEIEAFQDRSEEEASVNMIEEEDLMKDEDNEEQAEDNGEAEEDENEGEEENEENRDDEEEAEEAGEAEAEEMPEGVIAVTPEEFSRMDIDLSKATGTLLEPPLITLFSEAWYTELNDNNSKFTSAFEEPEDLL
ncbi:hypothetical protein NEFER03_1037 [Nematocida sp. LUAm3]|nr:hypothetical protein NEFER03_1037 [Nematocida sp. LUAm3]KAI5175359.1 hypothetical protein NEFER02_1288 [Nematocida sp. LUAm2]KAI5177684.1 hypothetical protein NEFER01_0908 [Nematocida sp. LUAm1]